jgi:hypothetical protein
MGSVAVGGGMTRRRCKQIPRYELTKQGRRPMIFSEAKQMVARRCVVTIRKLGKIGGPHVDPMRVVLVAAWLALPVRLGCVDGHDGYRGYVGTEGAVGGDACP